MRTIIFYDRSHSPVVVELKEYFREKQQINIILLTSIAKYREDVETYKAHGFIFEYELALERNMFYLLQFGKFFPDHPIIITLPDFIGDSRARELKKSNTFGFINESATLTEYIALTEGLVKTIDLRDRLAGAQDLYNGIIDEYSNYKEILRAKDTEIKRLQDYIDNIEIVDKLTQLHNERFFLNQTQIILDECKRYNDNVCIALIEIDNREQIGELYGDDGINFVNVEFAKLLMQHTRRNDCAGVVPDHTRFMITYKKINPQAVRVVTARLKESLEDYLFDYNNRHIRITVSIGLASTINYSKVTFELEELYSQSKIAIENAIKKGRNLLIAYS